VIGAPEHAVYLADRRRVAAYERAIRRVVRPGDRVIDLGCGTGLLGFLALRSGAAHVTAVERGPIIHVARRVARRNGLEDRVTFVHGDSSEARLSRRADLLVTETMGPMGLDEGLIEAVADARRRLLRRGARIIPRTIWIRGQPVSAPDLNRKYRACRRIGGLRFDAVAEGLRHAWDLLEPGTGRALAPARRIARVDLHRADYPVEGAARFRARRAGWVHGWAIWFEALLCPGVRLVSRSATHWRPGFLPIHPPATVRRGDRLAIRLSFNGPAEFHWTGSCGSRTFAHSTCLYGAAPMVGPDARPRLSAAEAGKVKILGLMNGRRTVRQIARAVGGRGILAHVRRLCLRDGVSLNGKMR
jgi:SAM-dependent methyltransferase